MRAALLLLISYLLGAISPSYLIVRMSSGVDLRAQGTGNLGTRNVLRTVGVFWAAITMLADIAKGFLAVYVTKTLLPQAEFLPLISMALVILGHNYSVFLRGKGGKGLAAAFGAGLAYSPAVILTTLGAGLIALGLTRKAYFTALVFTIAFPISVFYWTTSWQQTVLGVLVSLVVFSRHLKHLTGRWQDL